MEYILGLKLVDGGKSYEITPHMMGIRELEAKIPVKTGWLCIKVKDDEVISEIVDI